MGKKKAKFVLVAKHPEGGWGPVTHSETTDEPAMIVFETMPEAKGAGVAIIEALKEALKETEASGGDTEDIENAIDAGYQVLFRQKVDWDGPTVLYSKIRRNRQEETEELSLEEYGERMRAGAGA